jgi:hypothetical protein
MKLNINGIRSYPKRIETKQRPTVKCPSLHFVSTIPDLRKELFGRG